MHSIASTARSLLLTAIMCGDVRFPTPLKNRPYDHHVEVLPEKKKIEKYTDITRFHIVNK